MITINQYPYRIDLANSDVLWTLSSNSASRDQMQYITYLQDRNNTLLTTIKQQPNPYDKAVFNMGRIIRQYMDYDTDPDMFKAGTASLWYKQTNTGKYFSVVFNDEWGTSLTSSVATSSVLVSGSIPFYYFVNGTLNPNYGSFNWDTASYYVELPTPSGVTYTYEHALTTAPLTQYCQVQDYMTLSILNGNLEGEFVDAQDIYALEYEVFDGTTSVFTGIEYNINDGSQYSGGPRTSDAQLWSGVPNAAKTKSTASLLSVGVGPANLTKRGGFDFTTDNWTYYTVKLVGQQAPSTPNLNGVWAQYRIEKQTPACDYESVRFIWSNDLGGYDYYNATLAQAKSIGVERATYKANFVDYSTATTANYDITRRGTKAFDTKPTEVRSANTDWLDNTTAHWLEGLFTSPNVFIQQDDNIIPVIIDTVDVVTKQNPRSQKLFNYSIAFRISNNLRSR
jgi:hypothetical protein